MNAKQFRKAYFPPETEETAILIETEIAASPVEQNATFEDYEAFDLFE